MSDGDRSAMSHEMQKADDSSSSNSGVVDTEFHSLPLAKTTIDAYCRAVCTVQHNEFWWYYNGLTRRFRRQKPIQDSTGRWWWMVKPYFAWPVDFFRPITNAASVRPRPMLLGWQFPTIEAESNSIVRQNVISDLHGYGLDRIDRDKRRAVRRALRELRYEVVRPDDAAIAEEARVVWNSHVQRTGWNRTMGAEEFGQSWAELAQMPGSTVIAARESGGRGLLCAWMIARVLDETIYIDAIASHSDRVSGRPNDGLIFLALRSAAQAGAIRAHYSLLSRIESLEAFKRSLGFTPHPFACKLHLRRPIGAILHFLRPELYKRLQGDEEWRASTER
ncbi:MAG: hypothetical protein HY287_16685 [Planctomycetes bacterium]|nr:hypothetical protein [Planctomycetota bacterium]